MLIDVHRSKWLLIHRTSFSMSIVTGFSLQLVSTAVGYFCERLCFCSSRYSFSVVLCGMLLLSM